MGVAPTTRGSVVDQKRVSSEPSSSLASTAITIIVFQWGESIISQVRVRRRSASEMQQTTSSCSNCGAFARRSLHHEKEYQNSVVFERLRTSNSPAIDQEITHIRHNILPAVSEDILSIDSKLASLRNIIRSMEEERESLLNVQKKYSNLISLHRTFPSEIWSAIFLHTPSNNFVPTAFDASGSIWRLSHVCQRWRDVALSLQSFWSTINIYPLEAVQREADVERLEVVIQRSHQGLLNVSLEADRRTSLFDSPISRRILDLLFAESYRWRTAHLSFSRAEWNILFVPLRNRLPRLESLALFFGPGPFELDEQSSVSIFKDCPRLTKLTLGRGMLGVELPWHQITELDLSHIDIEDEEEEERRECLRMIERCPVLDILSTPLWDFEDVDEAESPNSPQTHSNAVKLDAVSVSVSLTLPLLREASLHPIPSFAQYNSLYSLKQLLIRSNRMNGLTSLSLASVPLASSPDRTLHSILSQTHALTSLQLTITIQEYSEQTDISDREQLVVLVRSLEVIRTESVSFLPLLSSLDIRVLNHRNSWFVPYFGPVGSLASVVKARWKGDDTVGSARLRTCHFSVQAHLLKDAVYREAGGDAVPRVFDEAERFIFQTLVEDGMDLAIRVTSRVAHNVGSDVVFAVSR